MRRCLLVLCIFSIVFSAPAQNKTSPRVRHLLSKADHYRTHFLFEKAIVNYKKVLVYKQDNYEAMVNMADCYFKLKDYTEALRWYDSVSVHNEILPPHTLQYIDAMQRTGNSPRAKDWLLQYLQSHPGDQQAQEKFEGIDSTSTFFRDSSRYAVSILPFNSNNPEFAPSFYGDGLVFVTNTDASGYLDLVYYPLKKGDSTSNIIGKPINSELHEGSAAFYEHDTKMIFTRNHKTKKGARGTVSVVHFQLFSSEKDANNQWKEPQLLTINDKQYSTGHPTVTSDGKTLYFSSNIPGGFGGADLYKSKWENNDWSTPKNLGAGVNTSGNEMFPYIFNDSILYFASDGYKGLGGLDLYRANIRTPQGVYNLGYPINSSSDDFSIAIFPDSKSGFFASNREGGRGNDDIYEFKVKAEEVPPPPAEKIQETPVTVFFTVQILALKNPKLVSRKFMKELRGVVLYKGKDGLNRYTYGEYEGIEEATTMLNNIKAMGYEDAFIRRVEKYSELADAPGENTDVLYEKMARSRK